LVENGHGKSGSHKTTGAIDSLLGEGTPAHALPSLRHALMVIAIGLPLWFGLTIAAWVWFGGDHVFTEIGTFFSKMAVVTFGGAYAVLAYVAQEAVQHYGWLRPGEMLDGLGMAETTPGPLIMVLQFVGFMGAFRNAGAIDPMLAGTLGGLLATWVTFVPCFIWVFLGAPYVEKLRGNQALSAALATITAAVVGVILNLAVWFALNVLFARVEELRTYGLTLHVPILSTIDFASLALTAAAMLAIFRFKLGMIPTLLACSLAGIGWYLLGGALRP
jgi:chromate transporter